MGDLDFLIGMPDVAGRPLTHGCRRSAIMSA